LFSYIYLDFGGILAHTGIIRDHYVFLVESLDAKHSGLVSELYSAGVLSKEERDNISCEMTSFAQNERLLLMLSRKTKNHFDEFLDALDKTGQPYVRNHIIKRQRSFCGCCFCFVQFFSLTLFIAIY